VLSNIEKQSRPIVGRIDGPFGSCVRAKIDKPWKTKMVWACRA